MSPCTYPTYSIPLVKINKLAENFIRWLRCAHRILEGSTFPRSVSHHAREVLRLEDAHVTAIVRDKKLLFDEAEYGSAVCVTVFGREVATQRRLLHKVQVSRGRVDRNLYREHHNKKKRWLK